MGFRNPFRIQVDSDNVAYVTDYSPDSNAPGALRGPAGTGRVEIVREPTNYGWPQCMTPDAADVPVGLQHVDDARRAVGLRRRGLRPAEHLAPQHGPRGHAAAHPAGPLVLVPGHDVGHALLRVLQRGVGPRAVRATCSRSSGRAASARTAPTKYEYDPDNPNATKFPPYYDDAVFFGEFTRDYLREIRLDEEGKIYKINNLLNCGGVRLDPRSRSSATTRWTCSSATTATSTCSRTVTASSPPTRTPACTSGSTSRATRAPQAVVSATPTDGLAPLEVEFSSEGSRDPDPSRLDHVRVGPRRGRRHRTPPTRTRSTRTRRTACTWPG